MILVYLVKRPSASSVSHAALCSVLFYIAYMREFKDPVSGKSHPCENGNCLSELQMQLMVVFTGKTIGKQIAYTLKPFVISFISSAVSNKHAKRIMKSSTAFTERMPKHLKDVFTTIGNGLDSVVHAGSPRAEVDRDDADEPYDVTSDPGPGIHNSMSKKAVYKQRSEAENQAHLMPFQSTFDDFCDRVIQYGYLVLFAPAFPLAPFLAFLNNVIEIRTSGYKYCRGIQRPAALPMQGIGSWFIVLNVLGFLAVLTNASMITFVGDYDARSHRLDTTGFIERTKQWILWSRFFVVEHLVLLMRVVILSISPSSPRWIATAKEVLEYRRSFKYRTEEEIKAQQARKAEFELRLQNGYKQLKYRLSGCSRQEVEQIFADADDDASGIIEPSEFGSFLKSVGVHFSAAEMDQAIAVIRKDKDDDNHRIIGINIKQVVAWVESEGLWEDPDGEADVREDDSTGIS
eukprot:SAG31_NODE_3603_length_4080_cov_2.228586_2_plen_461_part_00